MIPNISLDNNPSGVGEPTDAKNIGFVITLHSFILTNFSISGIFNFNLSYFLFASASDNP